MAFDGIDKNRLMMHNTIYRPYDDDYHIRATDEVYKEEK